jgi:hypothetical protein
MFEAKLGRNMPRDREGVFEEKLPIRIILVMPGLDPGILVLSLKERTWMAGTSPATTKNRRWGNGPRSALQASRACYGAIDGALRAACLEGGRSSLTLMV